MAGPTPATIGPIVMGQRGPTFRASAPTLLESNSMITVKGRKARPAASADQARERCSWTVSA
jgi:hypothetical protein